MEPDRVSQVRKDGRVTEDIEQRREGQRLREIRAEREHSEYADVGIFLFVGGRLCALCLIINIALVFEVTRNHTKLSRNKPSVHQ